MIPKLVNDDARIIVGGIEYHATNPLDVEEPTCEGCVFLGRAPLKCKATKEAGCMPSHRNDGVDVIWVLA